MIKLRLRSHIPDATPEEVFAALSDPEGLEAMLPRMRKIVFHNSSGTSADVTMHVAIGGMFGNIRCQGQLEWVENKQLTFKVTNPLPVETTWTLDEAVHGTEITVAMQLNLAPLLGPMASFVPRNVVQDMMISEMKHAIAQIPKRLAAQPKRAAA